MAKFDAAKFAVGVVDAAGPHVRQAIKDVQGAKDALAAVEQDAAATLQALSTEMDPARAAMLMQDLEVTLPARRAAIRSAMKSSSASDSAAAVDAVLDVAFKVLVAGARAFVPGL